MESKERGIRDRFRDWRHRRSRSHTPSRERVSDPPASGQAVSQAAGVDQSSSIGLGAEVGDMTLRLNTGEFAPENTAGTASASSAPHNDDKKLQKNVPLVTVSEPETALATVNSDHEVVTSIDDERSALWKYAYEELRKENQSLVEEYEMVLKEQAGVSQHGTMQEQMHEISKAQHLKCTNKQWSFQWFGQPQSVRDTIEQILNLTSRSASLISIGMTYAPPYVSVPWSAVTALIPLMMNDFKEHKGCIEGLEVVARLTFSYQMAEETFLGSPQTRSRYRESVLDLYKKILEYEALAMQYFGRSTLHRLGKNVAGSTRWADMPTQLSQIDNNTQRSTLFLGQLTLKEMLERQKEEISRLIQSAAAKKDEVAQATRWVSAISVELDHRDVRAKLGAQHLSSGDWFLEDPRVCAWKKWQWEDPIFQGHPRPQCLWLRGGVGTGKSSLASILIEELIGHADGSVAFFYCSKKADKINERSTGRNDHVNALRSLLSQASVSVDGSTVDKEVLKRAALDPRGNLAGVGLTAEDCVQMLDDIFSVGHDQKYTLVIDALDECLDHDELVNALHTASSARENVRIFLSSRFQVKVQDYFEDNVCVEVGQKNVKDIQRFLNIEIPRRRPGSGMTDRQAQRLIDTLVAKASGMFMWVKLQVNLFLNEIKSKRIRLAEDIEPKLLSLESSEAIGEELLYSTYKEVYEAAVGYQEDRRKEIVTTALRWVLCSFRTLTLRELAYATSVRPDGNVVESVQEGLVMDFCSNFLIEDTAGNVRLAHLSVRHYLEARAPPDFDAELAHLQAALACLYFANSPKYHEIGTSSTDAFQQGNVILTKSFRDYVQANWTLHCRQAKKTVEINKLMDQFSQKLASQKATASGEASNPSNTYPNHTTVDFTDRELPTTDASRKLIGLLGQNDRDAIDFIEQFIARGGDLSIQDGMGNTLLHEAVRYRVTEVVSLLLNAGAPLDARNDQGNAPLHLTALHRFDQGAQLLLQARADKNARNSRGETPLHIAISLEVQEVADTLLSANPDGLAKDHFGDTPIHRAAAMGNAITTESLLAMGFTPDGENSSGTTPLSLAVELHHPKVAKVLLENGATVTTSNIMGLRSQGLDELAQLHNKGGQTAYSRSAGPETTGQENKYTYSVKFPDGSRECDRCNISRWLTGSRMGTSYRHHSSLQQLFASAEKGCPLCKVFCRQLPDSKDLLRSAHAGEQLTVSLEPSQTQGSRQDRKDKLLLSAGSTELLTLELCLSNGYYGSKVMPQLDWLCGRPVEEQPLASSSLSKVIGWINTCRSEHHACRGSGVHDSILPTRVIDVGTEVDNIVRLHKSSSNERGNFVYLSFSWGKVRPAVMATPRNVQSMMAGIPTDSLSEIHRNAVDATRRLGFQYLWIDQLCIIQGDRSDIVTESPRMSEYLSKATFVLQASPHDSAKLYQPRRKSVLHMEITRARQFESAISDPEPSIMTGVELRLPPKTASEALGGLAIKRGWMFQEMILPRRMVIFGTDQIYWHCQAGLMSEGDTLTHEPILKLQCLSSAATDFERRDSLNSWYQLLSNYSAAKFSYSNDRLLGMASLARYFDADATLIDGLWKRDIQNGLLWRVDEIRTAHELQTDMATASWSWASIDGRVRYDLLQGARHDIAAQQSTVADICFDRNPYTLHPHLTHARYIELDALVRETRMSQLGKGCICFFDEIRWDVDWRDSKAFLFVFICPWTANPAGDIKQACVLGLIVRHLADKADTETFARCGIFLDTAYDTEMEGWRRRMLRIS